MRYSLIDPKLFIRHRQRLVEALPSQSYLILKAGKLIERSRDSNYAFRVDSNFFWVTGLEEPDSVLAVTAAGEAVLFLPQTTDFERLWNGPRLEATEAAQRSGIGDIRPLSQLSKFRRGLKGQLANLNEVMRPLRVIKDSAEIELLRRAAAITATGFAAAAAAITPGVMEYAVEAELTHQFVQAGASGHAYSPIVASGARADTLHYIDNDHQIKAGELVLIDAGAEYANYAADVTRVFAADGQLSDRQHQVYQAVKRVKVQATKLLGPDALLVENEQIIGQAMTKELIGLGVLSKSPEALAYRQFYPHATSHFLGLDVHDVGDVTKPLEPGMVVTIEPGIYLRDEGIGIRLEDDILITADGSENLTKSIPS